MNTTDADLGIYSNYIHLLGLKAITNLDELHPLYSLGADGHHGETNGGANNAVSPRDRQFEEGSDKLPDRWPCDQRTQILDILHI